MIWGLGNIKKYDANVIIFLILRKKNYNINLTLLAHFNPVTPLESHFIININLQNILNKRDSTNSQVSAFGVRFSFANVRV